MLLLIWSVLFPSICNSQCNPYIGGCCNPSTGACFRINCYVDYFGGTNCHTEYFSLPFSTYRVPKRPTVRPIIPDDDDDEDYYPRDKQRNRQREPEVKNAPSNIYEHIWEYGKKHGGSFRGSD